MSDVDDTGIEEPPAGFVWRWEVDRKWAAGPRAGGRCRRLLAGHVACGAPAVASLNRQRMTRYGFVDSWWDYCADHMYGRRVVEHLDGWRVVVSRALRPADGEPDDFSFLSRDGDTQ